MEKNTKKKVVGGAVYAFCAFMLVTILCIAIITAIGSANKKTEDTAPATDITTADTTLTPQTSEIAPETESTAPETEQTANDVYDYFLPVNGYITKEYSADVPVFSLTMNDYRTHNGVDIEASVGAAVYSFADGTITKMYKDPFVGQCLEITHEDGMVSVYMNLSEDFPDGIAVDASVYGGQAVGCVGETCALEAADESHLHFELVNGNGERVNPLDYLDYEVSADTAYEDGE